MMETRKSSDDIKRGLNDTYAAISQHFDLTRHHPWPETVAFEERLRDEMGSSLSILDLGCGNGRNAVHLAGKGHRVLALDSVPEQLKVASKNATKGGVEEMIDFITASLPDIPLEDDSVDAVLYIATLHHLPTANERERSLQEAERVLIRGGQMLVSVWAIEQPKFVSHFSKHSIQGMEEGDLNLPWTRQADGRVFYRYYHFFGKDEFLSLFKGSGLEIVECFYRADNHYIRAVKP
jgi:ubiquinone/menaquinone biosynthesis C-methylase UbiE